MNSFRELKSQWDRVAAVASTLAGGLSLFLGWLGVSGEGLAANQIPYIVSGGLGGIFLMGVGAAMWLSADLRDEWLKLDRFESTLAAGFERLGMTDGPHQLEQSAVEEVVTSVAEDVVTASPAPSIDRRNPQPRRAPRQTKLNGSSGSNGSNGSSGSSGSNGSKRKNEVSAARSRKT